MKALSVKWPWCGLIAWGVKPLEVRSITTKYRGPLLVCASKRRSRDADARMVHVDHEPLLGVAVCVVDVVGSRPMVPDDEARAWCSYREGAWVWELANARQVERIEVRGRLSFFDIDDATIVPHAYPVPKAGRVRFT